jgi:hypothetical protein
MPDLEPFNDQQREAILCENKRVLVLLVQARAKQKHLFKNCCTLFSISR